MGLQWSLAMSFSWLEDSQDGQYAVAAPLVHFSCIHLGISRSSRTKIHLTSFYNVLNSALFDVFIAHNMLILRPRRDAWRL